MTGPRTRTRLATIGLTTAVAVGGLATIGAPAAAQIDPEKSRSHLFCYVGKMGGFGLDAPPRIGLSDFIHSSDVEVGAGIRFCNPVRKKKGRRVLAPIVSNRQHAKLYIVRSETGEGLTPVLYDNQIETLTVRNVSTNATAMLVPSRKHPHRFPHGFDHYACHAVEEPDRWRDRRFKLRDQFKNHRGTRVLEPWLFCAAAEKRHGDKTFVPKEPLVHYVCYRTERSRIAKVKRRASNQFEKRKRFTAKAANLLCVPSLATLPD